MRWGTILSLALWAVIVASIFVACGYVGLHQAPMFYETGGSEMPQRLHNLTKWFMLPEGHSMLFEGVKQRMVTIDVNCPSECNFYVVQDPEKVAEDPDRQTDLAAGRLSPDRPAASVSAKSDKDRSVTFLGRAIGRDSFEFGVEGPFELCCEGGSPMIYTADSTDVSTKIIAPVIFTKIANRRARNPQLELMQYQMRRNSEALFAQLERESSRRLQAMEKRLESYAEKRPQGAALAQGRTQPVSEPQSGAVGESGENEGESGAGAKPAKKPAAKPADNKAKA